MSSNHGIIKLKYEVPALIRTVGNMSHRSTPMTTSKYTSEQIAHFWNRVDKSAGDDGCWLWTAGKTGAGYGLLMFNCKHLTSHRLSYELTYGEIPDGMCVCHKCDNPPCCNPSHLFLGTHQDNARDREHKGRSRDQRGERNTSHKLTWAQVAEIRERHAQGGITQRALAKEYGVGDMTISDVIHHRLWKNGEE